jgi:hypothetical protein
MSATTTNNNTTTTSLQSLQTEIVELRIIVKDQTEQLKRNETMIAQLVNTLHGSDVSPTFGKNTVNDYFDKEDDDEYYSNEESDDDDEDVDDDDDNDDDEENELRNYSYEKRLDYLEKFVFELEQKFTEMEKRHQENRK